MKIVQQNKGFFFGNSPFGAKDMDVRDRIAQKRHLYQKEAMRVVSTANKGEKRLDKSVEDRRGQIRSLMEENDQLLKDYQECCQKMDQAKADYEIKDDSQEEKDLELLKKEHDCKGLGLTEEERERLKEIKSNMTEYQKISMDYYVVAADYKERLDDNNNKMVAEAGAIRSIGIERLKHHAMVDAEVAKDKILEAASKEIYGMLVEDARDKIDEKAEEIKEEAEKREEKEEEEEKRAEAAKDSKTEAQAIAEEIHAKVEEISEQVSESGEVMQDVQQVAQKVMQAQKLLEEELKGLMVDVDA